ncbi:MAG: glycolate oxidase subunit GlcE [Burkholderiaceae bacterium]
MSAEAALAELSALRERVLRADRLRRPLWLRGAGSKDFFGEPPAGDLLDLTRLRGVISYEPTELVITARGGTSLEAVQALLARHGQMLAFEPPAFGPRSTIGGVVAAGLSGPRRMASGSVRDFVLGAALLPASGELLYFGGQVMKNVAGYDVSRLLAGSLGILGLITEVSLKVLPVPAAQASLRMPVPGSRIIRLLNEWGGQPLPISATAWAPPAHGLGGVDAPGVLTVRLSGARAAVEHAAERIGEPFAAAGVTRLDPAEAERYWADVRDHRDPFFAGDAPLWRLSLPSTASLTDLPDLGDGRQFVEWGGALRWLRTAADATIVRAAAEHLGGTATLFRGGWRTGAQAGRSTPFGVFHPLAPVNMRLHRQLKQAFDPNGIFNPGRMVRGL